VAAWVKDDRLGLVIPYRKEGAAKRYLPDFVVELAKGERLIIEKKGRSETCLKSCGRALAQIGNQSWPVRRLAAPTLLRSD